MIFIPEQVCFHVVQIHLHAHCVHACLIKYLFTIIASFPHNLKEVYTVQLYNRLAYIYYILFTKENCLLFISVALALNLHFTTNRQRYEICLDVGADQGEGDFGGLYNPPPLHRWILLGNMPKNNFLVLAWSCDHYINTNTHKSTLLPSF